MTRLAMFASGRTRDRRARSAQALEKLPDAQLAALAKQLRTNDSVQDDAHGRRGRQGTSGGVDSTGIAIGAVRAERFDDEGGEYPLQAAVALAGIGAGAGIGIDALLNLPRTIYTRTPAAPVTVAPIVGPGAGGGAVRISF